MVAEAMKTEREYLMINLNKIKCKFLSRKIIANFPSNRLFIHYSAELPKLNIDTTYSGVLSVYRSMWELMSLIDYEEYQLKRY